MTGGDDATIATGGPATPRKRVPYFQRPKQPRHWRWLVAGVGKTLITLGLLMFAFVAYQLWGTGIETARSQNELESQFDTLMRSTTSVATTTSTTTVTTDTPSVPPESTVATTVPVTPDTPPIPSGDVVARLQIPNIDLDWFVVEGTDPADLKKGPGHFRETPMPGQLGNAAIAAHRTTYGAPFGDLDKLDPGELIIVTMANGAGTFTYSVTRTIIVDDTEYAAVIPTIDPTVATLTLATCHPKGTSENRMIVRAVLVPEQSGQVFATPLNTMPTEPDPTLPSEEPQTTVTDIPSKTGETMPASDTTSPAVVENTITEDGLRGGWFDDSAAIPDVLLWGLLLLAVGIGSYYVGKACNRLYVSFLIGFIPFVIVLYFFFENLNRLLPPGL